MMIALIQRVTQASVQVEDDIIAKIGTGMLVFVGIEKSDTDKELHKLTDKLLKYRIFADNNDKMNLNIGQIDGEILLVSQFTLAANTQKGNRPSFDSAMPPSQAKTMFEQFVAEIKAKHTRTQCGQFAANMQVSLINDGPVTFWLQA